MTSMLTKNSSSNMLDNHVGAKSSFSIYKTMENINQILNQQRTGDERILKEYMKDLEIARDKFCALYKNKPEELFDCLFDFLNYDLKKLARGKFYNTASKSTYENFEKSEMSEQFLNNMVRPDTKLSIPHAGGDCLHWAIFLRKFIDSWHIKGLRSCLVKYKNGTHTFVLINFNDKSYKAEIAGKNDCFIMQLSEHLILDRDIPLNTNVDLIVKARGKKDKLTQRFIDKHGKLHHIALSKEEVVLGLDGEEISLKLEHIDPQILHTLDGQEIIDYLISHSMISSQNLKKESIQDVLDITIGVGDTMNRQYLMDLFE